ncbi:MAG: hypothetical protein WC362_04335 [Methanoregula sp.]
MTFGTVSFGFFRNNERFRQNVLYWHVIPSCTELGTQCPGKSVPEFMDAWSEGIQVQNQIVFASAAAQLAKDKSP